MLPLFLSTYCYDGTVVVTGPLDMIQKKGWSLCLHYGFTKLLFQGMALKHAFKSSNIIGKSLLIYISNAEISLYNNNQHSDPC